jgi:osmotically-inducible protein OsmY
VLRLTRSTLLVAALLLVGCALLTGTPPTESSADQTLATRVREALVADPRLRGSQLDVCVRDGVATLTGRVPTFLERRRAIETALRVLGVRRVTSEIELAKP